LSVATVIRFPIEATQRRGRRPKPVRRYSLQFKQGTRERLRTIIAQALEILDSLEREAS
jgi:hypothetical protein